MKFLNMLDVALHLLGKWGHCLPRLIDDGHQAFTLDHIFIRKTDVEPFLLITFPRGFDWKMDILLCLS